MIKKKMVWEEIKIQHTSKGFSQIIKLRNKRKTKRKSGTSKTTNPIHVGYGLRCQENTCQISHAADKRHIKMIECLNLAKTIENEKMKVALPFPWWNSSLHHNLWQIPNPSSPQLQWHTADLYQGCWSIAGEVEKLNVSH